MLNYIVRSERACAKNSCSDYIHCSTCGQAAAAHSADKDSIEMVLREMQRYKKDLQNALREQAGMSERIAEFKTLQELNSSHLQVLQERKYNI